MGPGVIWGKRSSLAFVLPMAFPTLGMRQSSLSQIGRAHV